jgi:hypothetical protein
LTAAFYGANSGEGRVSMEHVIQACERVRQDGSIMGPFLFSNKDGIMNKKYTSLRRHAAELERIQRSESSSSHEGPLEFFHDTFGKPRSRQIGGSPAA